MIPQDLKFTKTHEWARAEDGSNLVVTGISEFAVGQLGDIVFVELPEVGAEVSSNQPCGAIESVKAAVDLFSPIDGKIIEVNDAVTEDLDGLSSDPYGKGWMLKIGARDSTQVGELMSAVDYEGFIQSEKP